MFRTRGGLYGYQTRYGYHHPRSAVEVFKDLVDDINREFLSDSDRRAQECRVGGDISALTRSMVSTITFGMNCVVITKKSSQDDAYSNRVYRFSKNL